MHTSTASRAALLLMGLGFCLSTAVAQEATIRKNLPQRLPTLPAIDSVTPTPMKGLYEVRVNGTELLYSDANGDFVLLQGELFDTRQRVNLTEARMNQLTAIAFKDLLAAIAREAATRADLATETPVENVTGGLAGAIVEGDLILKGEFEGTFTIPQKGLDDSDIRDSDFLAERRKKERLNLILWNAARLGAAVLVVSLLLDITGGVVGMRRASLEVANEARRPQVEDIEASQAITSRILELGVKRLLPMEMLALVNEKRPATVEFTNIQCEIKKAKDSTIPKPMMTVDAKTPNAGDISDFLKAVQSMPEVEAATNSEPRVRETSTTFRIEITFKQAVLLKTAETPKQ
ncbi:MAG: hypothetical protein RJB43_233 [Verrucomicrobiota bacterium]